MSKAGDALAAIAAAAATVEGVVAFRLGEPVRPPGVVVFPPEFTAATNCPGATAATFRVYVVVALGDRALEQLLELAPAIADAIEENTDAVFTRAVPGTYPAAVTGDLPAYEITVEHPI